MHTFSSRFGNPGGEWSRRHALAGGDVLRNPLGHLLPSCCLPDFKRPLVPTETPTNGEVQVPRIVGDRLQVHRAVMQHVAEHRPHELRLRMRTRAQLREAFRYVPVFQYCHDRFIRLARRKPVVLFLQIQDMDLLALLAIDASPRFLAKRLLLKQLREPVRHLVVLVPWVVRQGFLHGVDNMGQRIEANDVSGAIGGALRATNQRASQRVDLVETQTELLRVMESSQDREHPDAVGNEIGGVLGADDPLAESGYQKFFKLVENRGIRDAAGYQLDKMHVPRWIEEMDTAKPGSCMGRHGLG